MIAPTYSRRHFASLAGASVLTAALGGCAASRSTLSASAKKLSRPGIQLFTIRDSFKADPLAALTAIAKAGYVEVEFGGGNYFDREPAELREMLDKTGLVAPAMHVSLGDLTEQFDRVVAMASGTGASYVVLPSVPQSMRGSVEQWRMVATICTDTARKLADLGFGFAYHNHAFEFDRLTGETTGYDVLTGETPPDLVKLELDFYWALTGNQDPLELIDRHAGRIATCHVKDRLADGTMTLPGEGVVDFQAFFLNASKAGLEHFFVEYDRLMTVDPDRLRKAADTLKSMTIA